MPSTAHCPQQSEHSDLRVQGWSAGEKRDGKVFLQCLFRPPTPELTREVGCLSEGPDLPPTLKETESQEGEL